MTGTHGPAALAGELLLVLLVAGCAHSSATAGRAAATPAAVTDPTVFRNVARSVVLCKTTEADLRRRLGEPARDGILHGARVMSWIATHEPLTRYLAVLLDDRGVVVDVYWDIPTEIPWTPADQCRGQ